MKLQIITVGKPKLSYAQLGWKEYLGRLEKIHKISTLHLSDKYADDTAKLLEASHGTFRVALMIEGKAYSSPMLAKQLQDWEFTATPVSFTIGGPTGLPSGFVAAADFQWSLGPLTLPHDLAMIVTLEALYRASAINAGTPYHK